MRNISWFILSIGSALILGHTATFAQDAPRPPVQVIIGPNGVKVIDPRTGKEIPSVITKMANATPRAQADKKPGELEIEVELLRDLQLQVGKDGTPKILIVQSKVAEPLSADKKLDRLLKNVDELRKDVDGIKKKLDGKGSPEKFEWRFQWGGKGPAFPPGADKKLDKETLDRMKAAENLKALSEALRNYEDKKEAGKQTEKKPPAGREAELERRLEHILREAQELRREIREMQTPKKK